MRTCRLNGQLGRAKNRLPYVAPAFLGAPLGNFAPERRAGESAPAGLGACGCPFGEITGTHQLSLGLCEC